MMTELDCRILARACGLEWHYLVSDKLGALDHYTCSCGKEYVSKGTFYEHLVRSGVTFSTPDDWELVRVKVIIVDTVRLDNFYHFVHQSWEHKICFPATLEWILTLSPTDLCQLVCNWTKSRPDLFPWLVELM